MDSRDHISSELGGFFSQGHTEGTITTGTFAYDEDDLRQLVTRWLDLAESYQTSVSATAPMTSVSGPGLEFASEGQANAANASGSAYREHLRTSFDYCVGQAQRCQDALDEYLGVEHRNVRDILDSGPVDSGPRPGI
ncbi:MAG: hypothetical protein ACRDSK_11375 [Actinophytocola sp.]|uniref:hypothetical protein n=1 Tax=Actinophytocola sp. TaxID=1872138 RepID=UPI003D6B8EE0